MERSAAVETRREERVVQIRVVEAFDTLARVLLLPFLEGLLSRTLILLLEPVAIRVDMLLGRVGELFARHLLDLGFSAQGGAIEVADTNNDQDECSADGYDHW